MGSHALHHSVHFHGTSYQTSPHRLPCLPITPPRVRDDMHGRARRSTEVLSTILQLARKRAESGLYRDRRSIREGHRAH